MASGRLILLRHGHFQGSAENAENDCTGWADADLSELGKKEATDAGLLMKENGVKCDLVFTSVMKRSIRTAWTALIAQEEFSAPIVNAWRLNDRHYGELQPDAKSTPKSDKDAKIWRQSYDMSPPALKESDPRHPCQNPLYRHVPKTTLPSCESIRDTCERVLSFWTDRIAPALMADKTCLVVAHEQSLIALCQCIEGLSEAVALDLHIPAAVPLVYEFDMGLAFKKKYHLSDKPVESNSKAQVKKLNKKGTHAALCSPIHSDLRVKVLTTEGHPYRLDINEAHSDPSLQSSTTKLLIRRVDGPSTGPICAGHRIAIFPTEGVQGRLDVARPGDGDRPNCHANAEFDSWSTSFHIKPCEGSDELSYEQPVGIYATGDDQFRLDIGKGCMAGNVDLKTWSTEFFIEAV